MSGVARAACVVHESMALPADRPNPHPSESAPPAELRYRCCCGDEILVTDEMRECPACGQAVPQTLVSDPTLTLSFCSVSLAATGDFHASDGSAGEQPVPRRQLASRTGERLGHFLLQERLGEGEWVSCTARSTRLCNDTWRSRSCAAATVR